MFDGFIRSHAQLTPRAVAVITPVRTYTYAEFDADIDRFGAALLTLGITPAAGVISICMDNAYLTYALTAALARLGVASSPFNDPGAALRLVEERPDAGTENPGPRLVVLTPDWIAQVRAAEPVPLPARHLDLEAIGRVMLSSGTTRAPRRVAMRWRHIQACNLANLAGRGAGVHGVWAPLTTIEAMQGFTLAVSGWSQGCAVTCGVGVPQVPGLLEGHPQGLLGGTPAVLRDVLADLPAGFRPQPGWRISVGGSRLPAPLAREARLRLTPDLRVTYGTTEAPGNTLGFAADLETQPDQVGVVLGGAVFAFVDEAGRPVPDGRSGEIRIRGERVADGYLNDPEATAERFRDGWFHTRDVGRRLPDGRIVLEGRLDDRMNLEGGRKFMPSALEDAAGACPGILDCAAFAVPDAEGLDICWLAAVAAPGFDRDGLAVHLDAYPQLPPLRVAWIDEIPRNATGKVDRNALRDALLAATGQA